MVFNHMFFHELHGQNLEAAVRLGEIWITVGMPWRIRRVHGDERYIYLHWSHKNQLNVGTLPETNSKST